MPDKRHREMDGRFDEEDYFFELEILRDSKAVALARFFELELRARHHPQRRGFDVTLVVARATNLLFPDGCFGLTKNHFPILSKEPAIANASGDSTEGNFTRSLYLLETPTYRVCPRSKYFCFELEPSEQKLSVILPRERLRACFSPRLTIRLQSRFGDVMRELQR